MDNHTQAVIDALNSEEPLIRILAKSMHTNLIIVNNGTDKNPDYTIRGMDLVIKEMERAIEWKSSGKKTTE